MNQQWNIARAVREAREIIFDIEQGNLSVAAEKYQTANNRVLLAACIGAHEYVDGPQDAARLVILLSTHRPGSHFG